MHLSFICVRKIGLFLAVLLFIAPNSFASPFEPLPIKPAYQLSHHITAPGTGDPQISPDGNLVAIETITRPEDADATAGPPGQEVDSYFTETGKSRQLTGATLFVASLATPRALVDVLPGADSWGPAWSPDGSRIAFFSDKDGAINLWLYDVETSTSRRLSAEALKGWVWSGGEPRWTADGQSILVGLMPEATTVPEEEEVSPYRDVSDGGRAFAFYSDAVLRGGEAPEVGDDLRYRRFAMERDHAVWALIDAETGETTLEVKGGEESPISMAHLSPSGEWLATISIIRNDTSNVFRFTQDLEMRNLETGDAERLASGNRTGQPFYTRQYRWHPAQDVLVFFRNGALWKKDLENGGAETQLAADLGVLNTSTLAMSRDGDHVLVAQVRDTADRLPPLVKAAADYYLVPMDGGPSLPLAIDQDRWGVREAFAVDGRVLWQPDALGDAVVFHVRDKATGHPHFILARPGDDTVEELFSWDGTVKSLNAAPNYQTFVAELESFDVKPDLYRFDATFDAPTRVTDFNAALAGFDVGTRHTLTVATPLPEGDGVVDLPVGVLLPPGVDRGDRTPAVVYFYPGLSTLRFMNGFQARGTSQHIHLGVLSSRGYAVIFAHALQGPGGEPGHVLDEVTDSLLAQIEAVEEAGILEIDGLALTGNSFGGTLTAGVLARTDIFDAGIATNGSYDIGGVNYGGFLTFANPGSLRGSRWLESGQPRIGNHPWAELDRVLANSPYYQADKIQTPLLLIEGGADGPTEGTEMMFSALNRLGQVAELAVYDDAGHVISGWPNDQATAATLRILRFLDTHVKTGD